MTEHQLESLKEEKPQPNDSGGGDNNSVSGSVSVTKAIATPKAIGKRQQQQHQLQPSSADGFHLLSTSPDSANGDNNSATQPPSASASRLVVEQAFYQCACADQCVTLKNILDSFKAPLSEEQAWAFIYQFASFYHNKVALQIHSSVGFELPQTFQLHVHRDGSVHFSNGNEKRADGEGNQQSTKELQDQSKEQQKQKSLQDHHHHHHNHHESNNNNNENNNSSSADSRTFDNHHTPLVVSHRKVISELAMIVYAALDYNLPADEECQMSQDLNDLFTFMTADENDDDCIDEGIDEGDKRWDDEAEEERNDTKELEHIIETCRNHIQPTVPEVHYKAVCRALVSETIELRAFLQQVLNNGAEKLIKASETSQTTQQELAKLGFNDWARFWVQVIDELRRGVRLKKSTYERTPIEYELTPYEILMEDIRSKKYQLRKVMVNGDIPPRVKKDAHALILEFIRSRPPLKKASERQLGPPLKCTPTPREQLMDSIRKGTELKHFSPPVQPRLKDRLLPSSSSLTSSSSSSTQPRSKQRLIKVDFSQLQDDEHIFDESSTSSASAAATLAHNHHLAELHRCSQPKMPPYPIGGYMQQVRPDGQTSLTRPRRTTYDLATQCESRRASLRRHTIVGCQSNLDETHSMPPSRPESRQSQAAMDEVSSLHKESNHNKPQQSYKRSKSPLAQSNNGDQEKQNSGEMHSETHSTSSLGPWNKSFMDKQTWMERGEDRLSVTLEEIVHIRSVMTKAELESLPMDVRVKEDVEKRKVCFLCLRTRFSIFGPWGIQCKLCQRTVCAKCYTKMRIPSEHFRDVPLVMISPSLLSSPASSSTPSPSHHHAHQTHSSSTGNIMDDQFPKSLIERLLRSESERKTRNSVGSAPSSPKHQRSNMSTPGISVGPGAAAATGQAVEALHAQNSMSASYTAAMRPSTALQQHQQKHFNVMSRSMEGPRSLPVHSPAHRPFSNSSTLERKSRFSRGFTLFSSGSQLAQDQKENMRGEQVTVCHDCQGLVNEITSSAKQKRSSARNRTLQNLTLDLTPVWK